MSDDRTDDLRDIFLDVAGDETITERQEVGPSHAPVDGEAAELEASLSEAAMDDGLDDAVDTDFGDAGATPTA